MEENGEIKLPNLSSKINLIDNQPFRKNRLINPINFRIFDYIKRERYIILNINQ